MKKLIFSTVMGFAVMTTISSVHAQTTSSGGLTVNGTIQPSISLTFASDTSGVSLTGISGNTGTGATSNAAATLAFGNVAAYGLVPPTHVTQTLVGSGASVTAFTIATPFDIQVTEANSTSASYTLAAQLQTLDSNSNTWVIDSATITSASSTPVNTTQSYGAPISHTLTITIPVGNTSGSINNTINFTATAN
jgi:hypothetical protein